MSYRHKRLRNSQLSLAGTLYEIDNEGRILGKLGALAEDICRRHPNIDFVPDAPKPKPEPEPELEAKPEPVEKKPKSNPKPKSKKKGSGKGGGKTK